MATDPNVPKSQVLCYLPPPANLHLEPDDIVLACHTTTSDLALVAAMEGIPDSAKRLLARANLTLVAAAHAILRLRGKPTDVDGCVMVAQGPPSDDERHDLMWCECHKSYTWGDCCER